MTDEQLAERLGYQSVAEMLTNCSRTRNILMIAEGEPGSYVGAWSKYDGATEWTFEPKKR